MRSDWELIRRVHRGHSYWRRNADGAIGIADDSGTYPENCEPGDKPPLLLDRSRPINISGTMCTVPVRRSDNRASWTPVGGFEALWVAVTFRMEIESIERAGATPWRFAVIDAATLDASGGDLKGLREQWMADLVKQVTS